MLIYCTLQMHVQQVTYANLLGVLHMNVLQHRILNTSIGRQPEQQK